MKIYRVGVLDRSLTIKQEGRVYPDKDEALRVAKAVISVSDAVHAWVEEAEDTLEWTVDWESTKARFK